MPRLSIVIPWREDTAAFEDTLVSVLQNRPAHCEILVVHAQPYDDPYALAGEVRFLHVEERNEIALINAGLEAARAEIVHVLQCGVEVVEGWSDAALGAFHDRRLAAVAPLILQRSDPLRLAAVGVTFSRSGMRRVCGLGQRRDRWQYVSDSILSPTIAAGFYRRDVLVGLGGFDATLGPRYADIDLGLTLAALGYRCAVVEQSLVLGQAERPGRGSYREGRQAERLFWRHTPGGFANWLRHVAAVVASYSTRVASPGSAGGLAGRLVGCCNWGSRRRDLLRLHQLQASAAPTSAAPQAQRTMRKAA